MAAGASPPVGDTAVQQRAPLVEAVPNFSEGRDPRVIAAISEALDGDGAQVLHVDRNPDANRTVVTLAGPLPAVTSALFRGMAAAVQSIDMRRQDGAHIRVGSADVVPLVCLEPDELALSACVREMAALAGRVGTDLGVPVFLYEKSALRPAFRSLPRCRRGGYEALAQRFASGGADGPDLGPDEFTESVAQTGASVLGVRELLVALNFTL
ncbi:MAG TPA: glutamate formimidoyltransferase, partial [Deltaproteobacteria bacterium]|nr:glutamate formimidoyltransferase [Deltaproteobacteria bacterium]